jgi:hypothetical protein
VGGPYSGKGDFFKKDTWLLLAPPTELTVALFCKYTLVEKRITLEGARTPPRSG